MIDLKSEVITTLSKEQEKDVKEFFKEKGISTAVLVCLEESFNNITFRWIGEDNILRFETIKK